VIAVIGSKGGVGTTTVAAGLAHAANTAVFAADLGATNDLALADASCQLWSLDSLALLPEHKLSQTLHTLSAARATQVFSLSWVGRVLYGQTAAAILDTLESHGVVVADLGCQPLPQALELATHVVLVITPDPRSLRRAEKLQTLCNSRAASLVLNFARPGDQAQNGETVVLPDVGQADPLDDEAWSQAVRGLAGQLGLFVEQPGVPQTARPRSRKSFSWRSLLPRVRLVE